MKIKYFAWVKEITNKDHEIIDKDYPKNIDELKIILTKNYPALEKHIVNDILRYAINMEYSSKNQNLISTDEIAIFPPVSGG
jgi:MoaD family protein, archaeal